MRLELGEEMTVVAQTARAAKVNDKWETPPSNLSFRSLVAVEW